MSLIVEIKNLHFHGDRYSQRYDLCVHGEIYIKVANETMCDKKYHDWNISCFVLRLLKAINYGHICDDNHPLISKKEYESICIEKNTGTSQIGNLKLGEQNEKDNLIDFSIINYGNDIKIVTSNDSTAIVSYYEMRKIISKLVNEVERFYQDNEQREFDDIDSDYAKKEYDNYWNAWNNYLRKMNNTYANTTVDSYSPLGINFVNPDIITEKNIVKISKVGIIYNTGEENKFIDFEACADIFLKENSIVNEKVVAYKYKPDSVSNYMQLNFFTYPKCVLLEFRNNPGISRFFDSKLITFERLENQIRKYDWSIQEKYRQ